LYYKMEGPVRYKGSVESYLIVDGAGSHTVDLGTSVLSMKISTLPTRSTAYVITRSQSYGACTRNVLTFVNTTAIAGCQDQRKKAEFWRYAIAVVFTNVRTLRV